MIFRIHLKSGEEKLVAADSCGADSKTNDLILEKVSEEVRKDAFGREYRPDLEVARFRDGAWEYFLAVDAESEGAA